MSDGKDDVDEEGCRSVNRESSKSWKKNIGRMRSGGMVWLAGSRSNKGIHNPWMPSGQFSAPPVLCLIVLVSELNFNALGASQTCIFDIY